MKILSSCSILALTTLVACGGSSSTPLSPDDVVGRSFFANSVQTRLTGNASSAVGGAAVRVTFVDEDSVDVIVNGVTTRLDLTLDDVYESADGSMGLGVSNTLDGVRAKDMLYFIIGRSPNGFDEYANFFVHGDRTATSRLPSSGSATYTGPAGLVDGAENDRLGSITLTANFDDATIAGSLSDVLPTAPGADFVILSAPINGNGFTSTMTSADVVVTGSLIDGHFYGRDYGEVGGMLRLETSAGNAAGLFGAAR